MAKTCVNFSKKCGGCPLLALPYPRQTAEKQQRLQKLLGGFAPVAPLRTMAEPWHYRNKAIASFATQQGKLVCGLYAEGTHKVLPSADCLLQNGAKHVYAVDVGHGQMAYSLRNDERVTCMEKYNARYMQVEDIEAVDFACTDVSFISLELILPPIYRCMKDGAQAVALIKPQFEAGREQIGKGGVVRDAKIHEQVCCKILSFAQNLGFSVKGLEESPIMGPKGNREFLLYLQKGGELLSASALQALALMAVQAGR